MDGISTEQIISLIKDNSNLPFYCFVSCDVYDDDYGNILQKITDIDINEIWYDDGTGRVYVRSYDEDDLIGEYLDSIFDDIGEDEYNQHDEDYWENIAQNWVDSLDWEECVLAYADNF